MDQNVDVRCMFGQEGADGFKAQSFPLKCKSRHPGPFVPVRRLDDISGKNRTSTLLVLPVTDQIIDHRRIGKG